MINIILYGSALDTAVKHAIFEDLAHRFCISYHDNKTLTRVGIGEEIMVLDTEQLSAIALDRCILLMKTDARPSDLSLLSSDTLAIANSENQLQLGALSKLQIPVITCGMGQKDTISFSSCGDESMVISLQRTISSLFGNTIEPLEIPIQNAYDIDGYALLAYTALRLLLEDINGIVT